MKSNLKKVFLLVLLSGIALPAFAQVDIRVFQHSTYVSMDTLTLTIDVHDNSGTGAGNQIIYFNVYNLSPTQAETFYLEAEWLCSNSSAFYQFCQEYPPTYTSGTCHTFHKEGMTMYDGYDLLIPPDTCSYNYLRCHFFIYDYSVEPEHEKICRFRIKRRNTHEVLDSMYLIIRRGNLPCSANPTGILTLPADDVAEVYPNPARNLLTIAAKQDQLTGCSLYSLDGRIIWDRHIDQGKSSNINVGDLSNGIYYLKLTDSKGGSFYKKIVVDH